MNKKQIENNIRLIANINGVAVEKAVTEIVKYVVYEIETQIFKQKSKAIINSNYGAELRAKVKSRLVRIHQERKRLMKLHKTMSYHKAFKKAIKNIDDK